MTLRLGAQPATVLSRIDTTSPGCSVKDSFADLDLTPYGFRELFAASWIGRPGGATRESSRTSRGTGARWARVTDAAALAAWESARGNAPADSVLRPALVSAPGVTVLAAHDGDDVVAGCVLTSVDPAVVGVSNVFAVGGSAVDPWAGVRAWAAEHHAGVPLVGYESGDDLAAALAAGFAVLGPLRVWMALDRDGRSPGPD